ncbi:ROK family protein [Vibrio sp.]|nr:ROK family protein [Vibrio sp.]
MYKFQPGHIDHIKQANTGRVYQLIDQLGPISRIALSKASNMAPASITKITRELLNGHLIEEVAIQDAGSRGRPAVGIQIKYRDWQFLSVRLGRKYLSLSLHNLNGQTLANSRTTIDCSVIEHIPTLISQQIDRFFETNINQIERITGLALTLPGLVDATTGDLIRLFDKDMNTYPLGQELKELTGLPVFIANDTKAWALAERLFGHSKDIDNSILLTIHHGVNSGIVVNHQVLQGVYDHIGDLGHIKITGNQTQCECGQIGCLNTLASTDAISKRVAELVSQGRSTDIENPENTDIDDVCVAAAKGDALAIEVLQELGMNLGKGAAMLINLFKPEKLLIGGILNQAEEILFPKMIEQLQIECSASYLQDLEISGSLFFPKTTIPGVALVKQSLYDGSFLMKLLEG